MKPFQRSRFSRSHECRDQGVGRKRRIRSNWGRSPQDVWFYLFSMRFVSGNGYDHQVAVCCARWSAPQELEVYELQTCSDRKHVCSRRRAPLTCALVIFFDVVYLHFKHFERC